MKVYIVTLLAFVLVTLLICVLARFSPNQWEEPDACVKDPEELSNQFNLSNSSWFVIGALMQQGSDIVPISLCVRQEEMPPLSSVLTVFILQVCLRDVVLLCLDHDCFLHS